MKVRPIILCGGAGTRLWPASRTSMPKQFIVFEGERSPFQETLLRVADRDLFERPVVVAAEDQRFMIERQLAAIGLSATVLLEPVARNSGPAVLAGCLQVAQDGGGLVAVLASDHAIADPAAFRGSLVEACAPARTGAIVAFGMRPTHPATGLGYIRPAELGRPGASPIRHFAEKPDAATAERLIREGYLWNSGNLLAEAATLVAEYARLQPAASSAVSQAFAARRRATGAELLEAEAYGLAEALSIDYAVMELTSRASVLAADWGWSDIGTWQALWEAGAKDADRNVLLGDVEAVDTRDCYIRSNGQVVSLLGARGLIVVAEQDAVLVADRRCADQVRGLVARLKGRGVSQATDHARVHRPWGWYEVRDRSTGFQVKRIAVNPGGRLSLQKHRFRAEHWVVVSGVARVTVDGVVRDLGPNEHAEIPLGAVHRLENPGEGPLEIVEVQHGTYLGEDDIVRFDDVYDRAVQAAE